MTSTRTLSEADSKELLRSYGLPLLDERLSATVDEAVEAAEAIGFPVVAKLCGDAIAHKTERGLVRLGLGTADDVRVAASELLDAATTEDGPVEVLVAPMVRGSRELIAGLSRDPQFGMTVALGVGGILAEALADVAIRLVPIERADAEEMVGDLEHQSLLGAFRGEPAVEIDGIVDVLMSLGEVAAQHPEIASVDLNPLIVVDGQPVAVDALVEIFETGAAGASA